MQDRIFSALMPNGDLECTRPLYLFSYDLQKTIRLFLFTVELAARADEGAVQASKALLTHARTDEERLKYQKNIDDAGMGVFKHLAEYSTLNSRHLVTNTVDLYLWYLSKIVQNVIKKQPNILRSSETIRVDDLLNFNDQKEIIDYLIDRKVNELSYGGLKKVEAFMADRLGISMFLDDKSRNMLIIFIELRNIHIHNRGFVNRLFLSRVGSVEGFDFQIDQRYHVDFDKFGDLAENCIASARNLDRKIAEKFQLERKPFSTWYEELHKSK